VQVYYTLDAFLSIVIQLTT